MIEVAFTPGDFKDKVAPGPGPKGPGIGNSEDMQDARVIVKDENDKVVSVTPAIPTNTEGLKEGVSVPVGATTGLPPMAQSDGQGNLKVGEKVISGPDLEEDETAEIAHGGSRQDEVKSGRVNDGGDAIQRAAADQTEEDKENDDDKEDEDNDD